jgi:hypothetical protein
MPDFPFATPQLMTHWQIYGKKPTQLLGTGITDIAGGL